MTLPHAYADLDERDTVPGILARRAAETPDRHWLTDITGGESLTFGEAHDLVLRWADALRRIGVAPGDRVGVMLPNSVNAVAAWLGIGWVHGAEVPLNTAFRGDMLTYFLTYAGMSVAIVSEQFVDRFVEVAERAPDLRTVVVIDHDAATPLPAIGSATVLSGDEFLRDATPATDLAMPMPWDVQSIIYTSGTTGPSKGVVTPWGMFNLGVALLDDLGPDDVFFSPFPMFHMSGKASILQSVYMNGQAVFRDAFDTGSFWADIDKHGCTFTMVVPAMAHWLLAQPPSPDDRNHALQKIFMMPIVPGFGERFGVSVRTAFGMTEVGNVMSRRDVTDASPSCGRPLPGYEVRVVDEHDYEVATGEVGELILRTHRPWHMSIGYWDMPEATAASWRNGWFHTGDAFRQDDDGNFFFVDRQKDALRRRGENISSFEVEALVMAHPDVAECGAIGVDSEIGEQEVKVCVVRREGADISAAALVAALEKAMPRYMVPRYVEFVDSLPRTEATMRIQKAKLRVDPLNANTWDRQAAPAT
jgi:carnitine-CoA ligase